MTNKFEAHERIKANTVRLSVLVML